MSLSVGCVGDVILGRRLPGVEPAGGVRPGIWGKLDACDVRIANMEFVTPGRPAVPSAVPSIIRLGCEPWAVDEVRRLGFQAVALANNHALDYGIDGLVATLENLERRGLAYCGAGRSLDEARRPAYVDVPHSRVAILSVTSSMAHASAAADGSGGAGDRPGVNPLRWRESFALEEELFADLARIDAALGTDRAEGFNARMGRSAPARDGADGYRRFLGHDFHPGPSGVRSECDPTDLAAVERWIGEARRQAEVVIVNLHAHESAMAGWNMEAPADLVVQAARAFVEAGAHVVAGHGPHRIRGVERYKGGVIAYSLGNFVFADESIGLVPPEQYVLAGLPDSSTPADFHDWREHGEQGKPKGFFTDEVFWDGLLAEVRVAASDTEVVLHPVTLAHKTARWRRGLPAPAAGDDFDRILETLRRSSEDWGTEFRVEGRTAERSITVVG